MSVHNVRFGMYNGLNHDCKYLRPYREAYEPIYALKINQTTLYRKNKIIFYTDLL